VVRKRGQDLTPPRPEEVILRVCPRESGIEHRAADRPVVMGVAQAGKAATA
jgi:hypothetical protein